MSTKTEATIEDLYNMPANGKAEIVNGELVLMPPTGGVPGRAGGEIYISLRDYERRTGSGYAFPDNVGFIVNLPNRRSFSPDAAFYTGELRGGLFLEGAPVFAAGTLVVWDVDVLRERLVRVYRAGDPENPTVYRSGQVAEAEPALPGWTMPVDDFLP